MALYASEGGSGSNYEPIPEGTYPGICYSIVDLGDQYSEKYDKVAHKCRITWEVVGETIEVDGKEINRSISKEYTLSLSTKSNLRADLRAWRGREFTKEELAKFNVKNILGVPCMMNIVHNTSGEKTYSNISSIMAMPKGMPKPEQTNETTYWDFDENAVDDDTFRKLPEFLQERIKESQTWKYITTGERGPLPGGRVEEIEQGVSYKAMHPEGGDFAPLTEEDPEVPF